VFTQAWNLAREETTTLNATKNKLDEKVRSGELAPTAAAQQMMGLMARFVAESFPILTEALSSAYITARFALILPFKMVTFTLHNYLTKRDYSY